jgi:hypothetical protein
MFILFVALATLGAGCAKETAITENTNVADVNTQVNENTNTAEVFPEGTIVVDAIDGTLTGAEPSTMDFIMEISTGTVAYLGSKGATANYTVNAPIAGTYKLHIKLSDDGMWEDTYRDADIAVNGQAVLHYYHKSEDTRGWKWFTIGNASLKKGDNPVSFSKSNDMPASFTMDEFRFEPVILSQ